MGSLRTKVPADADLELLVDKVLVVDSPDPVVDEINKLIAEVGGWGTLQIESHDFHDAPEPWFRSLEIVASEVAPRIGLPNPISKAA